MPDKNDEEKKGYRVIDKRNAPDEEEVKETPQPETSARVEPAAEAPKQDAAPQQEPGSMQDPLQFDPGAGDAAAREPKMADAIFLAIEEIRRHSMYALGMSILDPKPEADVDEALKVKKIFGALMEDFQCQIVASQLAAQERPDIPLEQVIEICFNLVQTHSAVFMGLVEHPATGKAIRDMQQAKLGIDFCVKLLEQAKTFSSKESADRLQQAVSELQMIFVKVT